VTSRHWLLPSNLHRVFVNYNSRLDVDFVDDGIDAEDHPAYRSVNQIRPIILSQIGVLETPIHGRRRTPSAMSALLDSHRAVARKITGNPANAYSRTKEIFALTR
jgi:hypothetical protein